MEIRKSLAGIVSGALLVMSLPIAVGAAMMTGTPTDFTDVNASNPNYTAIMYLKDHGVISGYPDGSFKPDQVVNRAEALKIILLGSNMQVAASIDLEPFRDVTRTEWYATYIAKAKELAIVQGYDDGTFKPAQTVNLVENLKMLLLTQKTDLTAMTVTADPYADAYASQWYAKYVQYAKDKNLLDADSKNMIYPAQGMTRAKLAEAMYRLMYMKEMGWDMYMAGTQQHLACIKEGESLGALVPGNTDTVCCSGLTPYIPEGMTGTRGTCQQPGYTQQSTQQLTTNIDIKDFAFVEKNITVKAGSTVIWTNGDLVPHTVTSDTGSVLDSGNLSLGQTYSMTFTTPGTYSYHCAVHPSMTGTVTVTQ